MAKDFNFFQGKITLSNGPGCYKITEDPLWLLSVIPLNKKSYLEVGCATGVLSLILKLKNQQAKIKAIDIQDSMIEQAIQHANKNEIKNIKFEKQDLFKLNNQEKYDCVFSNPPFLKEDCCNYIQDNIKRIAFLQTDITMFICKLLDFVRNDGHLCFIGHISVRDEIIELLKDNYDLTEIALISAKNKPAKRFIYIIKKNNSKSFNKFQLNCFDNNIRKEILFAYQTLKENKLKKIN